MRNLPSLWRNNSFWDLSNMHKQIDRMYDDFFSREAWDIVPTGAFNVSCEIKEMGDHYLLSFDLPGVKKEDIKIELRDNLLTVSGERKEEREEKGKKTYRSERSYGAFERTMSVSQGIKPEQIQADYKDGVLRVAVPKTEASKTQQIKIGETKPGFFEKLLSKKEEKIAVEQRATEKVA